ncbi:MAG: AAA family ATPase [Candidatus Mycalebacterium zealandia]|nr:MAG: AAA family ATPase [Candidatus Mycalebacterium zealandia]
MLEVSTEEKNQRLVTDNPWWQDPNDVRWKEFTKRVYFALFYELIRKTEVNRAVVLMGPRRVGKTVMAYQAIAGLIKEEINPKNILYTPLDNPLYAGMPLEKILVAFLELNKIPQGETVYVFFDEIQYLKEWEIHLKSLVDSYPQHRFVATGSAAAALKLKSTESGAGRFTDFILPPLTFHEYMKFSGEEEKLFEQDAGLFVNAGKAMQNIDKINEHFVDYLNFGGYPEAVFSEEVKKDLARFIKSDVIEKVLLRDLPSLYGISDIPELNRLFVTIAHNTGKEINLRDLSQGANVAKATISRYLEYLEAAFLIRRVRRVDKNIKKFKRDHTFKIYLTNPSMYAALFGLTDGSKNNAVLGRLVETAVFSHLFHLIRGAEAPYYARWKSGEVDLIMMDESGTKAEAAIEIKWSDKPYDDLSEIKGLLDFAKKHNIENDGKLACLTKSRFGVKPYKNGTVFFYPTSLFCFELGKILNSKDFRESFVKKLLEGKT